MSTIAEQVQIETTGGRAVVALDLSLTGTGLCTIDATGIRTHTITSKVDDGTPSGFAARCSSIVDGIAGQVAHLADDALLLVEGLSMHSKSSSLDRIFASWWMILADYQRRYGVDPVVISPSQRAMYATGRGNARKDDVLLAVARRYPDVDIRDNNQADALAMAAMGCRHLGQPIEPSLPELHLRAMDAVKWPELTR